MATNSFYDNFSSLDSGKGIVGDFAHASALYRRNNFRLAPKVKFLYHVVVDVNTTALGVLGNSVFSLLNKREFNLLANAAAEAWRKLCGSFSSNGSISVGA